LEYDFFISAAKIANENDLIEALFFLDEKSTVQNKKQLIGNAKHTV